MIALPAAFRRTVLATYGDAGAAWLEELPTLVERCRAQWGLRADGRMPLSHAYVEPVRRRDGSPAVLKLVADAAAGEAEAAALACFAGEGAARLLAHDPRVGAVLLERLLPGTDLAAVTLRDDDAATTAAAGVMVRVRRAPPAGHRFPDAVAWGRALDRPAARSGALPRPAVEVARAEYAALCSSSAAAVLLHGDLHHFNILRAGDGWKAIDPKGVVAEPAFEAGALLRNPWGALLEQPQPAALLRRRIALLAEALGVDRERLRAWGRMQAVLAAAWSVEDGMDPAFPLRCAELLAGSARARG